MRSISWTILDVWGRLFWIFGTAETLKTDMGSLNLQPPKNWDQDALSSNILQCKNTNVRFSLDLKFSLAVLYYNFLLFISWHTVSAMIQPAQIIALSPKPTIFLIDHCWCSSTTVSRNHISGKLSPALGVFWIISSSSLFLFGWAMFVIT